VPNVLESHIRICQYLSDITIAMTIAMTITAPDAMSFPRTIRGTRDDFLPPGLTVASKGCQFFFFPAADDKQ
jgi:hypothetical protein